MIISEVVRMLEEAKAKYGDIDVYVDLDYGQRPVEKDDDPLCKSPEFEEATPLLPKRIVI